MVIKREDKYIIEESQEINLGESIGWTGKVLKAFPAFKHKNYRLFFSGQLISLVGTWLQIVALGWLVLELTNSAFWVGTISALSLLPVLIFGIFGGVIVDRYNKKMLLYITQTLSMILALILGFLTVFNLINLWEIGILAFLLGTVTALDHPARQTFVVEMVGKEDLASAIALNSTTFNASRVIGPGVAGILIKLIGTGGTFILNGLSFIAVIIALYFIKVSKESPKAHPHPMAAIKEGLRYSFTHPVIKMLLIFSAVTSIFGWSYSTILPVIVQNIYHKDAAALGYLYSATGAGALLSAFIVSAYSKKINPLVFILGGNTAFAVSLVLFSLTKSFLLALPILFVSGAGLIMQFSMINTTIQHMVSDNIRGRVLSIYTLMLFGMAPFGSFQIGIVADRFGSPFAIQLGALIVFAYGIYVFLNRNRVRLSYKNYISKNS